MSLGEFVEDVRTYVDKHGVREGLRRGVGDVEASLYRRVLSEFDYGTPIYEKDWEILVVLDGCRYDLMQEFVAERDSMSSPDLSMAESVGCFSGEWMEKNFVPAYTEEMSKTVYVTGNPFSARKVVHHVCEVCGTEFPDLDPKRVVDVVKCGECGYTGGPEESHPFLELDEMWKSEWSDDDGTILPQSLSERAIYHGRNTDYERMVIHYMQPHFPFVTDNLTHGMDVSNFKSDANVTPWDRIEEGELTKERVWRAYKKNLQYVVENVETTLLENIDSNNVVLTSDHGNLIGEANRYGHPGHFPHPNLVNVPWYRTSGVDRGTMDTGDISRAETDGDVAERLADLGYL